MYRQTPLTFRWTVPLSCWNRFLILSLWCPFNPIPDGDKKVRIHEARSHIWLPRQPMGERESWRHAVAVVRSSAPSLRRSLRQGSSETAWYSDYWQGECPGKGWWWRGLKESHKPPSCLEYTQTTPKSDGFPHSTDLQIAKTLFFLYIFTST